MKIAFVIYNGMTALDFIGVYDAVTRLKTMGFLDDLAWDICAHSSEVQDGAGLRLMPTQVNTSLAHYDMVIVPGGFATRTLQEDSAFMAWLKTATDCPLKVSVCTGALLFGALGFLTGKRATTHPTAFSHL